MPTVITRGGMSAQGFGFGAVASKLYVENVFSTWLYTGNGSTQTITNGINLSGNGGLVWVKRRNNVANHFLFDTARGVNVEINSNTTDANTTLANSVTAFNSNGFAIGSATGINTSTATYASWTFRKAPKFFDVVTWTGNGANRTIAHNLGVAPGCIIVKRTDTTADWQVYHRSNANTEYMVLNTTAAKATGTTRWNSTTPTATEFTVGTDATVNASGGTYVAYLFAHDATADGIIQCGSYTGNGSSNGPTVNLGWEPQWMLVKSTGVEQWNLYDVMRGQPSAIADTGNCKILLPASSTDELSGYAISPKSTGFQVVSTHSSTNTNGQTYIYVAIRRGPMKTPTVGTNVFASTFFGGGTVYYPSGFPTDTAISGVRGGNAFNFYVASRLLGGNNSEVTSSTGSEIVDPGNYFDNMVGYGPPFTGGTNTAYIGWLFRRAPSYFDVVCYTGTGAAQTLNHNLGVAPELMIIKSRSGAGTLWYTYCSQLGIDKMVRLNTTDPAYSGFSGILNNTVPSATSFSLATTNSDTNASGTTYVTYLFASCPGVSKVGSYTGNGSSQTINCGFTNGARFFLVKASSASGDWWVWDSARGITAPADPALRLNSTAAEVTSADATDPDNSGIIVNQEGTCNINVNGATYIFLAVA